MPIYEMKKNNKIASELLSVIIASWALLLWFVMSPEPLNAIIILKFTAVLLLYTIKQYPQEA